MIQEAMSARRLLETVVRTVPQWYLADYGSNPSTLACRGEEIVFYSKRALTPDLKRILDYANENLDHWNDSMPSEPTRANFAQVGQAIALHWLEGRDAAVGWSRLVNYIEELSFRTYENSAVSLNLVIGSGTGSGDLTDPGIQKILDPLACSPHTYIRCDKALNVVDFREIRWNSVSDNPDYKFNPEFLQPLRSAIGTGEFGVHLSRRGDLIILDSGGILASLRKGDWFIYDAATLKNCIGDAIGDYRIGCNLFEVVFDLSYRRCGALLVYDPRGDVRHHIVNKTSILDTSAGTPDRARQCLAASIRPIAMGNAQRQRRKKLLFVEVASVDGAVVFDGNFVHSFGSMIETHTAVGAFSGARSTAAHSAFLWGGIPVKVSADGEIAILFRSRDASGQECMAQLQFL